MKKKPASKAATSAKMRLDDNWNGIVGSTPSGSGGGFQNAFTGLGTFERDKVMQGGYMAPVRVSDPELAALFNGNDIAKKIVQLRITEMFRRGYDLKLLSSSGKDGGQDTLANKALDLRKYGTALQVDTKVKNAAIFSRLFGGGLLLVGADDGQDVSKPLNEDRIKSVKYLNYVDRRYLFARDYYGNPFAPNFGEVETYQVTSAFGDQHESVVHESRCIRFDGADVEIQMRRQLAGWTMSVLQAPYDALRMFDTSFQAVANLMTDMSQAVFKMRGLAEMLTSNHKQDVQTRMQMVDMMRSTARMLLLDAEGEEFERTQTPMTGVADAIDRFMTRMASAADMPVTILFGRSPAGLNATGDADFRAFYDTIASEQKNILQPKLSRLYTLFAKAKDSPMAGQMPDGGLEFVFHKLRVPDEKELADIHFIQSQADNLYVVNGTLLPEEVALSRFRAGELCLETEIDVKGRQASLKAEIQYGVDEATQRAAAGPPPPDVTPGEPPNAQTPAVGPATDTSRRQGGRGEGT